MNHPRKQLLDIIDEINMAAKPIKLVKCLAVHNEEDWVEFNLRNNYDEFDIIRIVEGAVVGRPNSTSNGGSTDRTLDIIREFPDPDDKIELLRIGRHFKSLEEQKQLFLEFANDGEWLFIVDCDEFYQEGDVNRVKKAIENNPAATEFIPVFLHFYRDFKHVKAPHPEWQPQHQRIFRYRDGLRYHTHPICTDQNGQCTYFSGEYQTRRLTLPGIYIYHYGHARGKEFHEMKKEFYKSELGKFALEDGTNASDKFDEKFVEFMEYTEPHDSILLYGGNHPKPLRSHPAHDQIDGFYKGKDFADWRTHLVYATRELPNIALLMMGPWQKTPPFFNVARI